MEKLAVAFFGLLLVLFIGSIIYKETFKDCDSPGGLTWTITMNPGEGSCSSGPGAGSGSGSKSGSDSDSDSDSGPNVSYMNQWYNSNPWNAWDSDFYDSSGNIIYIKKQKDASGNTVKPKDKPKSPSKDSKKDASGNQMMNLSLSDLLATIGMGSKPNPMANNFTYGSWTVPQPPTPPQPPAPQVYILPGMGNAHARSLNTMYNPNISAYYPSDDVSSYADDAWQGYSPTNLNTYRDIVQSSSMRQGSDYLTYAPAKNPADYIRKDSIPCYACTL